GSGGQGGTGGTHSTGNRASSGPTPPKPPPPRTLIDPPLHRVAEPGGSVNQVSGQDTPQPGPGRPRQPVGNPQPRPLGKSAAPAARGARAYTDREREDVGMALARLVLGGDEAEVIDIRAQHNVGADAIDELGQFFELKVHAGAIPNQVQLTDSEVQRALT